MVAHKFVVSNFLNIFLLLLNKGVRTIELLNKSVHRPCLYMYAVLVASRPALTQGLGGGTGVSLELRSLRPLFFQASKTLLRTSSFDCSFNDCVCSTTTTSNLMLSL